MNKKIHIRAYSATKLSKKQERITITGLVAFLVGYGVYQTVYATNEASYKYGLNGGLRLTLETPVYDNAPFVCDFISYIPGGEYAISCGVVPPSK
jgi:hypothetical protein